MKYKAFISYRHNENSRRHAVALETALKRYAKPTLARPMKIFRDEKHMKPDISLPKLIRDGLENSEFLIFLAEKSSAESQWCGEELEMWCGELNRTQNLIIVLIDNDIALDGTDGINWEKTDALPALLQPYLTSIPLYMDLRWAKSDTDTDLQHPKYRHEINALTARLRGVNPEDLNDEEIRVFRRNIRLRNGAISVLLAMLGVSVGAAWWAFRQQKVAEKKVRENYANDLIYKSKIALSDGDRNVAFRLAEFAYIYADPDNLNVVQALADALYYNDDPYHTPLPRVTSFEGHTSSINSVAFSRDGRYLASGSGDLTAKVWDLEGGKPIFTLKGHTSGINSVSFSPDGEFLATGAGEMFGTDNTVKIWDLKNGHAEHTLSGHSGMVRSVAFSPDGKFLVSGSQDYTVKIWNLKKDNASFDLDRYTQIVSSVAFSPDGKHLAVGSFDNTLKIWDITNGKSILTLIDPSNKDIGLDGAVISVAYSSNGKLIAVATLHEGIKIWDIKSRKVLTLAEEYDNLECNITFSPDNNYLAIGQDKSVQIWDLKSKKIALSLVGHLSKVTCIAFSPDGKRLATGSKDNTLRIWNLGSENTAFTIEGDKEKIVCMAFSNDGKYLATGDAGFIAKIWEVESGALTNALNVYPDNKELDGLISVDFSPNGRYLAVTSNWSSPPSIWNLENRKIVFRLKENNTATYHNVAYLIDGHPVALGIDSNWMVKTWDLASGEIMITIRNNTDRVSCLTFSSDGNRIALSENDTVKVWNCKNRNGTLIFIDHTENVSTLAFSPDGKYLAIAHDDNGTIKVLDLNSGKLSRTLLGHMDGVSAIAFSPNGMHLASGSNDRTARVWDWHGGKTILTFGGHILGVNKITFSSDSRHIAVISNDGTAKIWNLQADQLLMNWKTSFRQTGLALPQIQQYNLEGILDLHPDNESKLLATGEVWQIAAFGDLYTNKIRQTGFPKKEDYKRALRLYDYCVESGEAPEYFAQRVEELKKVWKEKTN